MHSDNRRTSQRKVLFSCFSTIDSLFQLIGFMVFVRDFMILIFSGAIVISERCIAYIAQYGTRIADMQLSVRFSEIIRDFTDRRPNDRATKSQTER